MIRRFGAPPQKGRTYTRRPGAYAILPRDGRVLLTYQHGLDPEFQLPGGGIDPGESPLRALHREVFEETGWHIARPRRIGAFKRFVYMPEYTLWAEKLCHIYVAHPVRSVCPPTEPEHESVWMTPQQAIATVGNDGDCMFLARFYQ
ncbi:NUDIX hydrolase [uncultured Tateyamaria sp.]|uniref:NUDIX hydrolase n=1 Tax=uncultured Tateyamaria sp. TaxID=455651 RepID=UPI002605AAA6|nr:NUDIX hydrolase [uncultured Tateyamaria sp.]